MTMQPILKSQTEWGWKIAAYLFLAGIGAGAYTWGVLADVSGKDAIIAKTGIMLGFPCLFVGMLFLVADLGVKPRALRAFMNPKTSWIARGTFIISAFMILGFLNIVLWDWLDNHVELRAALESANLVFALLTMIYTGVLLGASRPISLWSTSTLPILFLVSALSTGLMAIMLALSIVGAGGLLGIPVKVASITSATNIDIFVMLCEIAVVIFYLQATHKSDESRASAELMLKGKFSGHFWFGFVFLGLAIPLAISFAEEHSWLGSGVACLCGIIGGLFLRYVILACGVRAPLRAGGIEYTIPTFTAN